MRLLGGCCAAATGCSVPLCHLGLGSAAVPRLLSSAPADGGGGRQLLHTACAAAADAADAACSSPASEMGDSSAARAPPAGRRGARVRQHRLAASILLRAACRRCSGR